MIACLDMYNWPESRHAFEALWQYCYHELTAAGFEAPMVLSDQGEALAEAGRQGQLCLGQVCGITYARCNDEKPTYRYIGSWIDKDGDAPDGWYQSVIIARQLLPFERLLDQYLAVNAWTSYSGWYALRHHLMNAGHPPEIAKSVISGAHRQSLEMVANGKADWASIDSISWSMLTRFAPDLIHQVQVIKRTSPVLGLPLVTHALASDDMVDCLRSAITGFCQMKKGKDVMSQIGIGGMACCDPEQYAALRHHAGDC